MSVRPGASGYFGVRKGSAGAYDLLRFISETSFTSTPAQANTESYLDEGDITTTGKPGKPNWSVTLSVNDAALAYRRILNAFENEGILNFEEVTGNADRVTNANAGVAIADTGILTGSGNALDGGKLLSAFTPGRLLIMDDKAYHIEAMLSDVTVRVSFVGPVVAVAGKPSTVTVNANPETAFAAPASGAWELHDFQVTTTWTGKVTDAGGTSRSGTTRNETIQGSCDDFPTKTLTLGTV